MDTEFRFFEHFDDIPGANLMFQKWEKELAYIVAEVQDENGRVKTVVWSDDRHAFPRGHKEAKRYLRRQTHDHFEVRVLGGGYIRLDSGAKKMSLCGKSFSYGIDPDRARSSQLIRDCYPDWDVSIPG